LDARRPGTGRQPAEIVITYAHDWRTRLCEGDIVGVPLPPGRNGEG
jgi:hypothetical protein